MAKKEKHKKIESNDFRVVLDLSERLSRLLREFLHVSKSDWNFLMDRIRQYKDKGTPVYREWSKSKGKGKGRRYFAAPCEELKLVQKAILDRFLLSIQVHFVRHGNQRGSSILTNAEAHAGFAKSLFSVDIVNAFPTVFRSRIKANLKRPWYYACRMFSGVELNDDDKERMLEALVDLLAWRDRLPQGPPTSPRVLDIVCLKMDTEIYQMIQGNSTPFQEYCFTAYADDLAVSCNAESMPEELRDSVLRIVRDNGFIPHTRKDKTEYFSPETGKVPVITGLVINSTGRITIPPNKVNQLRSRLYNLLKKKEWDETDRGEAAGLVGGYIRQIYPDKLPSKLATLVVQAEERFRLEKSGVPVTIVVEGLPDFEEPSSVPDVPVDVEMVSE